jgi:membrane protein YdbS with pleckstrin-like domain
MYLKKEKKLKTRAAFVITIIFLLISAACLIINYSVNHSINWSLYPIGALIVIWATIIPFLIMKKNKALGLFAGLTITLLPFLFLIQNLASVKGWVIPLALPVAGLSLLAFGVSLIAFTYFKLNKFYLAALTVFLFGVIVNFGVGVIVNRFLNKNDTNDIYRVSTMSVSVILSLILIVAGYIKRNKTTAEDTV